MEWTEIWLPMLAATLLRIGIPLGLTLVAAWGLRQLDARWQREAEGTWTADSEVPSPFDRIKCWLVHDCTPEQREQCPAFKQRTEPCWQQMRDERGWLAERCLSCPVFRRGLSPQLP